MGRQRSGASTSTTATRRARLLRQSQSDGQILYDDRTRHRHSHHSRHPRHSSSPLPHKRHNEQHRQEQLRRRRDGPPSTHAVILPQGGGLVLVGEDGVRKSKFPRGCERAPGGSDGEAGRRADAAPEHSNAGSGGEEDVLTRLCNPKNFTGTAATGHLPTVVDLEGGVGVSELQKSAALPSRETSGPPPPRETFVRTVPSTQGRGRCFSEQRKSILKPFSFCPLASSGAAEG